MTRISWSPDGTRLLACQNGAVRVISPDDGTTIRELTHVRIVADDDRPDTPVVNALLDARWLVDGRVLAIDDSGRSHRYTLQFEHHGPDPLRYATYDSVVLAVRGNAFSGIVSRRNEVHVRSTSTAGETVWIFAQRRGSPRPPIHDGLCAALSDDATILVVGYATRGSARGPAGRGWVAYDLTELHRSAEPSYLRPEPPLIDRDWYPVETGAGVLQLAFARLGRRFAMAGPEAAGEYGAIRLRSGTTFADPVRGESRTIPGGACAIAIDDRGVLVARAYPAGAAEHRLRIDYLATHAKGAVVDVVDTLWLDPDCTAIVALAFDADSRRVACLDASGRVEVLPVL